MRISFDPAKRARNLAKHGLDLADAGEVLDGLCESRIDDRFDYGEERWMSTGMLRGGIGLCVWTEISEDEVRVMRRGVQPPDEPLARASSLRRATRNEQEDYFGQIGG